LAAIQFIDMMFFENNYWGLGTIWQIYLPPNIFMLRSQINVKNMIFIVG
jgi:hypothetical protein